MDIFDSFDKWVTGAENDGSRSDSDLEVDDDNDLPDMNGVEVDDGASTILPEGALSQGQSEDEAGSDKEEEDDAGSTKKNKDKRGRPKGKAKAKGKQACKREGK